MFLIVCYIFTSPTGASAPKLFYDCNEFQHSTLLIKNILLMTLLIVTLLVMTLLIMTQASFANIKAACKNVERNKHSSLLKPSVGDRGNKGLSFLHQGSML